MTRRSELVKSGPGSLGAALLRHCTENCAELLQTVHGGDLVACLAGDSSVGCMLWESDQAAVKHLHEAIAAAAVCEAAGPKGKVTSLLEHYFASRALKRIAAAKEGEACKHCALTLWENALCGSIAQHLGTHAAKIVAALAQGQPEVSRAVRPCLESVVKDTDAWISQLKEAKAAKT